MADFKTTTAMPRTHTQSADCAPSGDSPFAFGRVAHALVKAPQPLPDLIRPNLKAVFAGINPGACAAKAGHHFHGRGNRFWRVLHLAGFTPEQLDASQDAMLLQHGMGVTAMVDRPTARADQVSKEEFKAAVVGFRKKIELHRPGHIAFLGKVAFLTMFDKKDVQWGRQDLSISTSTVWVLPNPSGLNRAFSINDLVASYGQLRRALDEVPQG